jgi:hypothetical protein
MSIRDRVERHPLIFVAGIFAAGVTMAAGVMQFYAQQSDALQSGQHQTQINALVAQHTSEIEQLRRDADRTRTSLEARINQLSDKYDRDVSSLKAQNDIQIDELKREAEAAQRALETQLQDDRVKRETELTGLKEQLASIQLGLADKPYLDVRGLVHRRSDPTGIPEGSRLYEDLFYADGDNSEFSHSIVTELDLVKMIISPSLVSDIEVGLTTEQRDLLTRFPVHVWQSKTQHVVEAHQLAPSTAFVSVQAIAIDDYLDIVEQSVIEAASVSESFDNTTLTDTLKQVRTQMGNDVVGMTWASRLAQQLQFASIPRTLLTMDSAQKVDDVVYSRDLITLLDVIVDGKPVDRYYVRRDMIAFKTPSHLFMINTIIPTDDTSSRGEAFAAVVQWLGRFRALG